MNKFRFPQGIIIGLIVGLILGTVMAAYAAQAVRLVVNGQEVYSDVPAQVIDGRTLVPVRALAEALGATVEWDAASNTVYVTGANQSPDADSDIIKPIADSISLTSLYKPRTNFEEGYCVDQWPDGRPFTVLGVEYDKGVAFCGETGHDNPLYTSYSLDGKYTKLTGFVALDDADYNGSGFEINIRTDYHYCAGVKTCVGLAPQPFEIDVTGAKMLNIEWGAGNCTYPIIIDPVLQ